MRQLNALDASFLAMEQANSPMHVGSLAIYRPPQGKKNKTFFADLMQHVENRAKSVPAMTEVLKEVPP